MSTWDVLFSNKNNAVGEVAGIEAGVIEIYIYPEFYPQIGIGDILIINSENAKSIGIVLKLAHSSKYGSFTPVKMTRTEIIQAYPDLDRYHLFVSTIAYTSHIGSDNKIYHFRGTMPRLHDLAYLIKNKDLLRAFFKPINNWNFDFLRYYFAEGARLLEFREFIFRHRNLLKEYEEEKEDIIAAMVKVLSRIENIDLKRYLEELSEILEW